MSDSILVGEAAMASWVMRSYRRPWFFAGGWAIDLFLGRRRRFHKDVDIAVFRADQAELLRVLQNRKPRRLNNGEFQAWREGSSLEPSEFQVFCEPWAEYELDWEFLLESGSSARWVFRRNPDIWLPPESAYRETADGIPFLAPEIVLLFKAKYGLAPGSGESVTEELGRRNDEEDFHDAMEAMESSSRDWLAVAIEQAYPAELIGL